MSEIPKDHPRYASLMTREKIVEGVELGITSQQGLVAQGRGECFDYLIGEQTTDSALMAEKVAVAMLLLAEHPVLSVNGNAAALVPDSLVRLSEATGALLEVNLFHRTEGRVNRIIEHLKTNGASEVLGSRADARLDLQHSRGIVDSEGIYNADVVLVPLEDGDRCQALVDMGKRVITIDLNPLSRTSRTATVTIVDNVIRAVENMISLSHEMKGLDEAELRTLVEGHDNSHTLSDAVRQMIRKLEELSGL
ncbi:4-phosphopantoate--beta-alanine ligase [Methanococcoides methylutens]|uniref:4-phosphopantoate--beta-alanine ligase n=1 Tax=Methanococcoides methylutens MM1 TaxID=1434104 RepID=A0A0E3X0H4_METMT|nr:4-phosphopantoate--beta-alanine ligase [Methanococcoides methylutens]AKB85705.1 Phosphopantothenate synthetase, archaeal [Methanococcoides methylutens MM1]